MRAATLGFLVDRGPSFPSLAVSTEDLLSSFIIYHHVNLEYLTFDQTMTTFPPQQIVRSYTAHSHS